MQDKYDEAYSRILDALVAIEPEMSACTGLALLGYTLSSLFADAHFSAVKRGIDAQDSVRELERDSILWAATLFSAIQSIIPDYNQPVVMANVTNQN